MFLRNRSRKQDTELEVESPARFSHQLTYHGHEVVTYIEYNRILSS